MRPVDKVIEVANVLQYFFCDVDSQSCDPLVEGLSIDTVLEHITHTFYKSVGTDLLEALVQAVEVMSICSADIVLFQHIWYVLGEQLLILMKDMLINSTRIVGNLLNVSLQPSFELLLWLLMPHSIQQQVHWVCFVLVGVVYRR